MICTVFFQSNSGESKVVGRSAVQTTQLLVTLLVVITLIGCQRRAPPVRIVVPRAFRGEFQIVETPKGINVSLRNGEYVYVIPASGKLSVKSLDPFKRFHQETIGFDDGSPLSSYSHYTHADSDGLAVFGGAIVTGTTYPEPTKRFFVGRRPQAMEWTEQF